MTCVKEDIGGYLQKDLRHKSAGIKQTASNFCVIVGYRHRELKQIYLEKLIIA